MIGHRDNATSDDIVPTLIARGDALSLAAAQAITDLRSALAAPVEDTGDGWPEGALVYRSGGTWLA